jgi:putative ABC transport system permease protein
LNVLDRIPEIGLRMAIGARRRDIAWLFIFEAAGSSALGGALGAALAWLGVAAARAALGWPMAVDAEVLALPLAIAVVLGVGCSVGPAIRAAHLMPLEALNRG